MVNLFLKSFFCSIITLLAMACTSSNSSGNETPTVGQNLKPTEDSSISAARNTNLHDGTLANALENNLGLEDKLISQKCTKLNDTITIDLVSSYNDAIRCTIDFGPDHSALANYLCELTQDNRIGAGMCISSDGQNPIHFNLRYNGRNFQFKEATPPIFQTNCPDLNGDWMVEYHPYLEGNLKKYNGKIVHIEQDGCKTTKVSNTYTPPSDEPLSINFPIITGTLTNDNRTFAVPINNPKYPVTSTFSPDWMGIKWLLNTTTVYTKEIYLLPAKDTNGWDYLQVDDYNYLNNLTIRTLLVKVQKPVPGGSCHNLKFSEVPLGMVCKTSSGFLWKKTANGWADLSPKGKEWSVPFVLNDYVNTKNIVSVATKYCQSHGKSVPTGPALLSWPDKWDYSKGDSAVALDHEIREVFADFQTRVTDSYPQFHFRQHFVITQSESTYNSKAFIVGIIASASPDLIGYYGEAGYSKYRAEVMCVSEIK